MKLIAAIIAVLVVLAGTGFGLAARKLEWIGPRTVPTVRYRTAAEVSRELETKGFLVKKKQMFNALGKGKCLGLVGVKAGDRLPKGTTVTVIESMGPGVPEGTVGSEPSKAETALLKMGVRVVEHEVVSEHPGKVAVTMPADGEPVRDTDDGIHIGVGITGDGIPVEIAGMDKDEAKTKLQQQGFDVTLKPRFSSRKNLGKIVRADPGIGVRTSETNVTLYYGVDASKRYDVVGTSIPDRGSDKIMTNTVALAGKYCTDGGNCLTLEPGQTDPNPSGLVLDGKGSSDFFDQLTLCTYSQDISGCNPSSGGYYNAMKDFLIQGDTGAMELYAGFGLPVCGTTSYVGDGPTYCDGTSEKQVEDGSDGTAEQAMSEKYLKYVARDFFVVMPVGANLDQLESNGYFDGSTTYKPYADRPYLIRRDNSAYPEIKATNDTFHRKPNPYAPGTNMQPFKKAPNAHNVYYLVEQPVDFSQFEEATVSAAGGRETAPTRRLTTAPLPTATAMIPLNPMTHRNPSHRNPVREPTRTRGSRTVSTCLPVTSGSRSPTTATVASSTRRPAPRRSACGAATTRCLAPRRRSSTGSRRISAATRTYRSRRWPANRCTSAMSRTEPSRISAKSSPEGRSRPSKSRIRPANARAETNSRRRFR